MDLSFSVCTRVSVHRLIHHVSLSQYSYGNVLSRFRVNISQVACNFLGALFKSGVKFCSTLLNISIGFENLLEIIWEFSNKFAIQYFSTLFYLIEKVWVAEEMVIFVFDRRNCTVLMFVGTPSFTNIFNSQSLQWGEQDPHRCLDLLDY